MTQTSIIVSGDLLAKCFRATADAIQETTGIALFPEQFALLSFMALMLWDDPETRQIVMTLINRMNAEVLDGQQRLGRVSTGAN